MGGKELKRLHVAFREFPSGIEGLGSSSEVEGFRVEVRHWLLVVCLPACGTAELLQHLGIGAAVGGAKANVGTGFRALALEIVRPSSIRVHLYGDELRALPRMDLDLR